MLFFLKTSPIIILKKNKCINCHKIIKDSELPNFFKISNKYLNNKFNKKYLFKKIRLGGKGVWGNFIMPKNKIKNLFIKLLVKWILKLRKNY